MLYFLDSMYKQHYIVFVFLCLTYFIWHYALQIYPCCCKWQNFVLLDLYLEVELLSHMVAIFLVFLRHLHTVFHSGYTDVHSHQ